MLNRTDTAELMVKCGHATADGLGELGKESLVLHVRCHYLIGAHMTSTQLMSPAANLYCGGSHSTRC
jgi:hypothetical protein